MARSLVGEEPPCGSTTNKVAMIIIIIIIIINDSESNERVMESWASESEAIWRIDH